MRAHWEHTRCEAGEKTELSLQFRDGDPPGTSRPTYSSTEPTLYPAQTSWLRQLPCTANTVGLVVLNPRNEPRSLTRCTPEPVNFFDAGIATHFSARPVMKPHRLPQTDGFHVAHGPVRSCFHLFLWPHLENFCSFFPLFFSPRHQSLSSRPVSLP